MSKKLRPKFFYPHLGGARAPSAPLATPMVGALYYLNLRRRWFPFFDFKQNAKNAGNRNFIEAYVCQKISELTEV